MARYEAAQEWFDEKDHLVISNGPFYLERFDPPAQFAELDAFRDPGYPFHPGDLYRGEPPTLSIDDVAADVVVPGEDAVITVTARAPGPSACATCSSTRPTARSWPPGRQSRAMPGTFVVTIGAT